MSASGKRPVAALSGSAALTTVSPTVAGQDNVQDALEALASGAITAQPATFKSVARRGTIYGGLTVFPPEGRTCSMALKVTVDEASGLSFEWANYSRGFELPLTDVLVQMRLITPISSSSDFPGSPVLLPLSFDGLSTIRVAPGARVFTDPIARTVLLNDEPVVLVTAWGEGVLGVLGAAISSTGATSITGPQLPAAHPLRGRSFFIWVDSEVLLVSAGTTGTVWTVQRGMYSTTAATHSNGATVSHAVQVPIDYPTQSETNSHDWLGYYDLSQGALTANWIGGAQHYITTPAGMRATTVTPSDITVVSFQGDSISNGHGDDLQPKDQPAGFADRACVLAGLPSVKMAHEGMALTTWTLNPDFYWTRLRQYGATVHVIALGTNRSNETGATLFAQLLENVALARLYGAEKVIVCTIPPATDPGDTPDAGDANRIAYHALIRAGHPDIAWVADNASAVAADADNTRDVDGQFWYVDPNDGVFGTNLHPTTPGHIAMALILEDALQHVAAGETGGISQLNITPTAPTAPLNLTAAPAGSGQVALDWDAPASNGGRAITDYVIQYRTPAGSGSWSTFADGTSTATAATVTGLTNGSVYEFHVAAVNSIGTGTYSGSATATPASATVPGQVTGLGATAGNAQVALTWTAPASNGGSAVTTYLVEYRTPAGSGSYTTFTHSASTTPSITVTGLTNGSQYEFRVSAVNAIGSGTASSTATATPVASFDPATLSPSIWLKPESFSAASDGDPVASWTDSSGNSRHLTQATSGLRPVVKKGLGPNGIDLVRFDGVDDFLTIAYTIAQPAEIWVVCHYRAASASNYEMVWGRVNGGSFESLGWAALSSPRTLILNAGTSIDSGAIDVELSDAFHYVRSVVNGASSLVDVGTTNVVSGDAGSNSIPGFEIGARTEGFVSGFDVCEVFVVGSALNSTNRDHMRSYFAAKYGI